MGFAGLLVIFVACLGLLKSSGDLLRAKGLAMMISL